MLLIQDLYSFVIQTFRGTNLPLSTALAAVHKFCYFVIFIHSKVFIF